MMPLSRVAYAFLDRAEPAPVLDYRTVPAGVEGFLLDHVGALAKLAKESHPVAHFGDDIDRTSFELLLGGEAKLFLSTARKYCSQVHREMTKKPAAQAGFLVFAHTPHRADGSSIRRVAILKLDYSKKKVARAELSDPSNPAIEDVQDALELPGELQKGALYPDPRADSDVLVGDRARDVAMYFLDGLGLTEVASPSKAVPQLLAAVHRAAPQAIPAVVERLEALTARVAATAFLELNGDVLDEQVRGEVVRELRNARRPAVDIDPTRYEVRGEIVAGPLKIVGPRATIYAATWERNDRGGWTIKVDASVEPERRPL